ncbi:hypothetical protein E2C00_02655 [Streptomyces sp. WAC05374]|uniref:DUF6003 family protein n=1 Tax=Streptomyces sp. WAC05374 TaxID=2487420 RepID=UPI000F898B47|nr:DUF6003 family protein [Streptomyces sp. WAC05374]RST15062.1 hypothetical protein EF905_15905 [Streptomyces sp. WAC05374]TDF50411.1 hypothetical protein E2B92_02635 [Streptomyces sp. WAC05374]TDF51777.1 hypothetical protein E2C02_22820 [Streptomyces sp. WAC05374]TDF60665.1 hypothetical protein E2C00_02655 [Streptomyces sp. WAC05374]
MTDDAYLFLVDGPATAPGAPVTAVGDLACLETPAVRAWLDAHGVTAASGALRLLPPEETAAIPEGAEKLPVPLGDEELSQLRHALAPGALARVEEELLAYRDCAGDRDALLARAAAAGVAPHRIVELTGEDPATVASVASAAAGRRPGAADRRD